MPITYSDALQISNALSCCVFSYDGNDNDDVVWFLLSPSTLLRFPDLSPPAGVHKITASEFKRKVPHEGGEVGVVLQQAECRKSEAAGDDIDFAGGFLSVVRNRHVSFSRAGASC